MANTIVRPVVIHAVVNGSVCEPSSHLFLMRSLEDWPLHKIPASAKKINHEHVANLISADEP